MNSSLIVVASLFLFALFACPVAALDTKKPLAEFMHQTWSVDNGLPQSTIRDICQTKDGYLWFATHEGVARFDGLVFTVFDESNAPVLSGSGVVALLAQNDGGLLLGLRDGGLVRFYQGKFVQVNPKGGLPAGSISILAEDPTGALWVGTTTSGLARIVNGESRIYAVADGLPGNWVTAVRPAENGDIWIGTMQGAVIFRDGKIVKQPTNSWLDTASIEAIVQDEKKRLWFATSGEGLAVKTGESIRRYRRANGLASDNLVSLHIDRDGGLWIGTLEGVQRLVDEKFEAFASADGLTNNYIRDIFEDADGSVWVGTDRGIDRFRDSPIITWGSRKGLTEAFTRVAIEDRKGTIWVGTSDGLFAITPTIVRRYGREQGLLNGAILSLAEDGDGTLWVGTNGGGLHRMKGERFELISAKLGLSTASVRAILPTADGSLWIGTNAGLIKSTWRGEAGTVRLGTTDGLPSEQINALFEDAKGQIWIGARGGLSFLTKSVPMHVNALAQAPGSTATVLAINADSDGRLWVSTVSGLGLVRTEGSQQSLLLFTKKEGINAQTYFSAIDDARGNLWLCSNRGIFKVAKAQIDDVIAGKRIAVEPMAFGRAEGMKTAQCNGSSQPAGWRTRDGRLLFPTALGLAVAEPGRQATDSLQAPPVHIQSVLLNAVPRTPNADGVLVVPSGQQRMEISYVGLNLADPDKVRYRYQLIGFDSEWVDAGRETKAVYTNVAAGTYVFRVLAARVGGPWSEPGAMMKIEKQLRLHETIWFRVLFAVGFLLMVFVIYRGRTAQLNAQRIRLHLMIDERTRDLELEKQKLESINKEKAHLLLQVADAAKEYERLSKEDSLTGLSNRRELDRILSHELERAVRNGRPLSIALADIDFFKKINDLYSHAVGDEVLRVVANILKQGCRGIDMVGRYGGEEFVLVLPEADLDVARQICERLRVAIEQFDWPSKQARPKLTMSFGLVTLTGETTFERLVALADAKLYEAKAGGRNRVCS
ncbi:MAG: diguanylate cyclase [Burkholderiales bacterium]|nr:diguanylate cyclase [Burkholderiales bacterium]